MTYFHTPEFIKAAQRAGMTPDHYRAYIKSDAYKKRHAELDEQLAKYDVWRKERNANDPFLRAIDAILRD